MPGFAVYSLQYLATASAFFTSPTLASVTLGAIRTIRTRSADGTQRFAAFSLRRKPARAPRPRRRMQYPLSNLKRPCDTGQFAWKGVTHVAQVDFFRYRHLGVLTSACNFFWPFRFIQPTAREGRVHESSHLLALPLCCWFWSRPALTPRSRSPRKLTTSKSVRCMRSTGLASVRVRAMSRP